MVNLEWVEKLIGFDTTSYRSNLDLIDCVEEFLIANDFEVFRTFDKNREKANLFATLPAWDGRLTGGLILSGHTDVVPATGQQWNTDPFRATLLEGKLYGRGACDMKGFIGVALSKIPQLRQLKLRNPIHFALSYDEELCCAGAPSMIAEVVRRGIQPDGCIVGEPTEMSVVGAHKGISAYRCLVKGKSAHSSLLREGVNAIEFSARLITFIAQITRSKSLSGPFDIGFEVPHTTAQTGKIQGGIAMNTVAENCSFEFEFRNIPDDPPESIYRSIREFVTNELEVEMKQVWSHAGFLLEPIARAPALRFDGESELTNLAQVLSGKRGIKKVGYATEAGLFREVGIPAVVCGPGSIAQAHKPNEFVSIEQLNQCSQFLDGLIQSMSVR